MTSRKTIFRPILAATSIAVACAAALPAAAQPHLDGLWSPVYDWPLIAVHAALTPDGRVLSYGTKSDGTQTGFFSYDLWDTAAGPSGGHTTFGNGPARISFAARRSSCRSPATF